MNANTRTWVLGLAAALLAAGTSYLQAGMYDLQADWSDTANPNGPWSLKKNHTDLFTINHADYYQNGTNQHCWADETFGEQAHVPLWMKQNEDGLIIAHGAELDRTGSDYTAVTWTSPLAGVVHISGELWTTWVSNRTMRWQLRVQGSIVSEGDLYADGSHDETNPFNLASGSGGAAVLTQTAQVGDELELGLYSVDDGGNLGDWAGVKLTITPEPATLGLLTLGATALVRRKRSR